MEPTKKYNFTQHVLLLTNDVAMAAISFASYVIIITSSVIFIAYLVSSRKRRSYDLKARVGLRSSEDVALSRTRKNNQGNGPVYQNTNQPHTYENSPSINIPHQDGDRPTSEQPSIVDALPTYYEPVQAEGGSTRHTAKQMNPVRRLHQDTSAVTDGNAESGHDALEMRNRSNNTESRVDLSSLGDVGECGTRTDNNQGNVGPMCNQNRPHTYEQTLENIQQNRSTAEHLSTVDAMPSHYEPVRALPSNYEPVRTRGGSTQHAAKQRYPGRKLRDKPAVTKVAAESGNETSETTNISNDTESRAELSSSGDLPTYGTPTDENQGNVGPRSHNYEQTLGNIQRNMSTSEQLSTVDAMPSYYEPVQAKCGSKQHAAKQRHPGRRLQDKSAAPNRDAESVRQALEMTNQSNDRASRVGLSSMEDATACGTRTGQNQGNVDPMCKQNTQRHKYEQTLGSIQQNRSTSEQQSKVDAMPSYYEPVGALPSHYGPVQAQGGSAQHVAKQGVGSRIRLPYGDAESGYQALEMTNQPPAEYTMLNLAKRDG